MTTPSSTDRRSFMKWVVAAPLLAEIAARDLYAKAATLAGQEGNIYQRLGVKTVVNCRGTWTYLSGSLEWPEVRAAQVEAARHFVNILELQRAAGRKLAMLTGAPSGMVTSGAAGAMASATAGCIAGTDPKNVWQLPDTTGLKSEVIMMGGRSAFDSAIRLVGGKLVIANTVADLQPAITRQTAMVYTTWRDARIESILKITKPAGVPVLLDDAGGIPPFDNFRRYAKIGV